MAFVFLCRPAYKELISKFLDAFKPGGFLIALLANEVSEEQLLKTC